MGNPIQQLLRRSQNTWVLLAQTTVWVAASIAAFLLPPPVGTPEDSQIWVRFAQFVVTVLIGLLLLAAIRWQRQKDAARWAALAAVFLVAGGIVFFAYQILAVRWTTNYNGQRVLIGQVHTPFGREYVGQNPHLSPEQLVMNVAGKVDKIWTRDSLQQRRILLAGIYVLAMPLFAVCIMSVVQALQCSIAPSNGRKRPSRRLRKSANSPSDAAIPPASSA